MKVCLTDVTMEFIACSCESLMTSLMTILISGYDSFFGLYRGKTLKRFLTRLEICFGFQYMQKEKLTFQTLVLLLLHVSTTLRSSTGHKSKSRM